MKFPKKYLGIVIILVTVILTNIFPLRNIINEFEIVDMRHYSYSNSDDPNSTFSEHFGSYFWYRTTMDSAYRVMHPDKDTLLYRNFMRNPLCFWRWREYMFDEKYNLPYISKEEVILNSKKRK